MMNYIWVKMFVLLYVFLLIEKSASTHVETCDCDQIGEIVNKTLQKAIDYLENKLGTASSLESKLTTNVETLLAPIKLQLNYHLPPPAGVSNDNPVGSCKEIYDVENTALSGYYWISTSSSPVKVYCNMNASCGELRGGWMRVAYLDMKNSSHLCPSGMTTVTRNNSQRVCDITSGNHCISKIFSVHGLQYSHVYGRVIGYQKGWTIAFNYNGRSIDDAYVFGVSLTHGSPRKHIWTFAGAADELSNDYYYNCPCTHSSFSPSQFTSFIPSFVGNDYYCDTSLSGYFRTYPRSTISNADPLWDGEGCGPASTCCSSQSPGGCSVPWFSKNLPTKTTDDIKMRLCKPGGDGSTPIEMVEVYVQ